MADRKRRPGALFVSHCKKQRIGVSEANKLGIPIVAITDTNCDPDLIQHVIPGNDDAIRSCRLIVSTVGECIAEGLQQLGERELAERAETERREREQAAATAAAAKEAPAAADGAAAAEEPAPAAASPAATGGGAG
jgi:small subunit ribosomal protein S2